MNVSVEGSPSRVERGEAGAVLSKAPPRGLPQPVPPSGAYRAQYSYLQYVVVQVAADTNQLCPFAVDKWHYLSNL